jgi:cell division protein FtsB
MRYLSLSLVALLVLIQYPLWLGKGGWLRVWELDRQLSVQREANGRLDQRNAALEGEVRDLKQGLLAVEERARYELGMVRPDEIFVQFNAGSAAPPAPSKGGAPAPSSGSASDLRTASAEAALARSAGRGLDPR